MNSQCAFTTITLSDKILVILSPCRISYLSFVNLKKPLSLIIKILKRNKLNDTQQP